MTGTKGFSRALSREESQNSQNEDIEMGDLGTSNAVRIEIENELLNSHGAKKQKQSRKGKYLRFNSCVKKIVMSVLVLAVVWLSYMEVRRLLSTEELIQTDTQHDTHSGRPVPVAAFKQHNAEVTDNFFPEEYNLNIQRLYDQKDLQWVPEMGNSQILSKPATSPGCIELLTGGKYKIFNSITLTYENQRSLYHAVARRRANTAGRSIGQANMIVRKANFQWKTPQTGRQPSTLQFLVEVEAGDQLCVQTNNFGMIYASYLDNIFLIEKL